ncbi:threonine ammonia-lyase [Amycolatopsis nalaikhensis]|uniref:Threonine/serine dehydratase n=1 Tax=Amycolatopsis nalaikhensis TaxID=715472 RepID=A0ABY8XXP8_9PSEU|nr:threonine/serine dehydratase [Amycolatopsis sp. 2-2]WIV60362.1 threonine/serine dehydratase [Amycolatopsis sp. 2-2]
MELVTITDIEAAAERVRGVAVRTPLVLQTWDPRGTLWLKPESLQPIGAFKVRGAFNAIATLDDDRRARGVIAYSSGNHAQAVAYAAQRFGVPAVIVVPDIAPRIKVEATRSYGAEVIEVPIGDHEAKAHELAAERGLTLVAPFDDAAIIAGQGTAGLEIAEDLPDVEVVLVPVSGGGLAAGVGTAIKARCPRARVIGVEPALAADTAEGLRLGRRVDWPMADRARTIADGLRAQPSELTFAHLRKVVDDMVTVTEDEIRAAMRTLATKARLVAEPSGAVTTAAYLNHAAELPEGRTVAIVSGGNADPALFAEVLA